MASEPIGGDPVIADPGPGRVVPIQIATSPAGSPETAILAALLQFEADLRRRSTVAELCYHVANDSRRLLPYDQMFILRQGRLGEAHRVMAASSLATIDRNAPLVQAIEAVVIALGKDHDLTAPQAFAPKAFSQDPALDEYPFAAWHWQPLLTRDGQPFGGLIVARADPLREGEAFRLARIAETTSHAWRALTRDRPVNRITRFTAKQWRGIAIGGGIILMAPVQMTALAPVEVVPARPYVLAAPFSGVISRIHVIPNGVVKPGQLLLSFDDVKLRNELQVASEKLGVARARMERATSATFGDSAQARDIAIMRAEYDLAQAEYDFARDMMAKSQVRAPRGGMVLYSDRRDWEGRAVNVGDPVLQVADPRLVSFRIDLPAKEQMALKPGAPVKVWLDAQPLWAIDGALLTASYQARPTADNILAFALTAKPITTTPRIGSRGTAKVYGQWVPLIYSLLRRPIAGARQYLGL